MNVGKTLFAQVMEFIPWTSFTRIVDLHAGNAGVRKMSCAEQFRVMAFVQLTCVILFVAPRWLTPMKVGTGAFGLIWLHC